MRWSLLDEPTASLDLRHQVELLMLARRRAGRGVAVIAVLHDLNLATLFARRIVVMKDGRVHQDGAPSQTITAATVEHVFGMGAAVAAFRR